MCIILVYVYMLYVILYYINICILDVFINILCSNVLCSYVICSKEIRTPDHVRLFNRIQNLKYVKLRKRVVREKMTRVISRVGDGVNCPVHLQSRRICRIGIR